MGKVDLAFDHTNNHKDVNKLSVVLYTDSFFYGLWEDDFLVKAAYHPYDSLASLSSIWDYHFDFEDVRIMSANKPYVHLPQEFYQEKHFDIYFKGLYNLERVADFQKVKDKIRKQKINTLHFLDDQVINELNMQKWWKPQIGHISTAMVNYLQKGKEDLVFYSANNILHVAFFDKKGFRFYNQFDCYYAADYLYFTKLILQKFKYNDTAKGITFSGDMNLTQERMELLNKHYPNISYVETKLNVLKDLPHLPTNYYDLHLCRTCV